LWVFQQNGGYDYAPGALPRFLAEDLGEGDWINSVVTPNGSNKTILKDEDEDNDGVSDNLRFAVANSKTNSNPARKYSAVRWNPKIKELWGEFWYQLANYSYTEDGVTKKLGDHPALYSIITQESSLSGIYHNIDELDAIGYIGPQQYSEALLEQSIELSSYFVAVPILNNINWISENVANKLAPYYQQYLGDQLSSLNQTSNSHGWFAQDLRIDEYMGISSYQNIVYPEFSKFDKSMRYAMITGDTYKNSHFTSSTNQGKAQELIELASQLSIGHLLFLNQSQQQGSSTNSEIFNLIASADYDDYSFLPEAIPNLLSAVVNEGSDANRIVLTASNRVNNISSSGFSIKVDGQPATITHIQRDPADPTKIWVTLSDRIYKGEIVEIIYDGNELQNSQIAATNKCTVSPDPNPSMVKSYVYEGAHPDRIALFISEPVKKHVTSTGFSVAIDGQAASIINLVRHPTESARLWITLSNRINPGEIVLITYAGNGTIEDISGHELDAGTIRVTNKTTNSH
ncbi:MAG: hypothetical protein ABW107_12150, partial [Candidatus Thiodiazotropha sp. 6PLUC5]